MCPEGFRSVPGLVLWLGAVVVVVVVVGWKRSLGDNRANARGVRREGGRRRGGWRPSCPYLCPPCKLAGRKPEYNYKQQWERLDDDSETGLS